MNQQFLATFCAVVKLLCFWKVIINIFVLYRMYHVIAILLLFLNFL